MDVLHDTNWATWLHINNVLTPPSYVMQYTPLTKEATSTLSDKEYADDVNKLFPIDTRENTWLSAAYFGINEPNLHYKQAMYNYVKDNIRSAASVFGITEDVDSVFAKTANAVEVIDPVYGLTIAADGKDYRYFPMCDAYSVRKSANHFKEARFKFTPTQRRKCATEIIKQADIYNVSTSDLPAEVLADAGYGIPDRMQVATELLDRAHLFKDAELSMAAANIAEMVGTLGTPADSTDFLTKLSETIQELDNVGGLTNRVHRGTLIAPEDIVFGVNPEQAAAQLNDAVVLNKYAFSLTKLANLSPEVYEPVLGDLVETLKTNGKIDGVKLAAAITSMSKNTRIALEDHLSSI